MAYLGNAPARSFISFERQVFTIVNSQTAYALSHSVTNENDIRLVVNNVVQEPGSGKAYTATGTALTLSAALTNGTDEMYCVFLGRATATNAPGAGSVGTSQLANDAVTLAKMASGTDGNIISYDASGNPVAVATGNDGQVLTSTGAGSPPAFETPASAANTPAFFAYLNTKQTVSDNTNTKIQIEVEDFDTDGAYNTSTYKFQPQTAGKYCVNVSVLTDTDEAGATSIDGLDVYIYKNGSQYANSRNDMQSSEFRMTYATVEAIIDFNGSSDYVEPYARLNVNTGTPIFEPSTAWKRSTRFSAYKIIT